jgi:TDG/mug DNA glycosylase family protein
MARATNLDVVAPGLRVLIVGINPGLFSAAVGHNFARPGNRFWKALHAAGITPSLLAPADERRLLDLGVGITNLVARPTATADLLAASEIVRGGGRLRTRLRRLRPRVVAFLGLGAYRTAFGAPKVAVGPLPERLEGARVWVLPNPSGLNAHYQLDALGALFAAMWRDACSADADEEEGRQERKRTR